MFALNLERSRDDQRELAFFFGRLERRFERAFVHLCSEKPWRRIHADAGMRAASGAAYRRGTVARTAMDLAEEYDHASMRQVRCVVLGCPARHEQRGAAAHLLRCRRLRAAYAAVRACEWVLLLSTHPRVAGLGAALRVLGSDPALLAAATPWPLFRFRSLAEASAEAAALSEWMYGGSHAEESEGGSVDESD